MIPYNMHTLDDTSHPAKIEPALPIQAAEKKQTGSDTSDFSLSLIAYVYSKRIFSFKQLGTLV